MCCPPSSAVPPRVLCAHGGSITVVGLDADVVTLRLSGACHGCRFTDDTVRRVIEPAVGRVFPQMTVVVER